MGPITGIERKVRWVLLTVLHPILGGLELFPTKFSSTVRFPIEELFAFDLLSFSRFHQLQH